MFTYILKQFFIEACGKIHSVEELEARLRKEQGLGKPVDYNQPRNKEEELQAFRKLVGSINFIYYYDLYYFHSSAMGYFWSSLKNCNIVIIKLKHNLEIIKIENHPWLEFYCSDHASPLCRKW